MAETVQLTISTPENPYCMMVRICGSAAGNDDATIAKFQNLRSRKNLAAKFERAGQVFFAILFGGNETSRGHHLHIDIARESYFDDEQPKVTVELPELEKFVSEFSPLELRAHITGRYAVPLEKISKDSFVARAMMPPITGGKDEIEIKQTGSAFCFTNSPIDTISWNVEEGKYFLEMKAERTAKLDEQYFRRIYAPLENAFKTLVVAGGTAGVAQPTK